MSAGRVVGTLLSCTVVAGCAVVVVGMTRAATGPRPDESPVAAASAPGYEPRLPTLRDDEGSAAGPAALSPSPAASTSSSSPAGARTVPVPPSRASSRASTAVSSAAPNVASTIVTTAPAAVVPATTAAPAPRVAPRTSTPPTAARHPAPRTTAPRSAPRAAPQPARPAVVGQRLPLGYTTGNATKVVTVTAGSSRSTTATLQAWVKVAAGRWKKSGSAIRAHVGSDGIGKASETRSKTPAGSWTLTQAFGRRSDPGTALPYVKTTPSDYWISSPGRLYNTRQRCGSCGYNNGVNERLYYVTPQYDYAAVIDYNTRNAPGGVKQGRGSAFFLHVTDGTATAGCVAISQSRLVSLLRWLTPKSHPRILIGVT